MEPYIPQQPIGPPFAPPRRPPFGTPERPPITPPGGPPTSPPIGPPPTFRPERAPFRIDPGAIVQCLYRYTYIWLRNGREFWFYPVFIGRRSIAGYRWAGFFWVYYGTDLNNISSFICY